LPVLFIDIYERHLRRLLSEAGAATGIMLGYPRLRPGDIREGVRRLADVLSVP
jgi:hypothetical protein